MTEMMSKEQLSCVAPVVCDVQIHGVPDRAEQVQFDQWTKVQNSVREAV